MFTFYQFIESKKDEDLEEKSGMDVDHDKEKGESQAHKDKVAKKHKEMIEFFTARRDGARKILNESKSKNTPASKLTVYHFQAKLDEYYQVIEAIKTNKIRSFFESKFRIALEKVKNKGIKQKPFQEYMGILEVWGEAISQLFN